MSEQVQSAMGSTTSFQGRFPAEMLGRQALVAAARANGMIRATSSTVSENPSSALQRFGIAIVLFFPLLAACVIGLRVYSRVRTKQFGLDDSVILVAMVLSIGETAASYMYIKTNFIGIHAANIPADHDERAALVWNFVVQVLYNPILALVKTSMLLFLLKLGSQKRAVRLSVYALNTLNIALMVAIFIVVIFQCEPIAYNWDTSLDGHCIQQGTFYIATAALTIFTDIFSLVIPFWVFLDLKMPRRVKVALLFVFLLGGLVTAIGIIRLVFLYRAFFLPATSDPTYTLGFCLSAIETNIAIMCASAPSLRGLVRYWFPHFFSSNRPTYDYRDGYAGGSSRGRGGRGGRSGRAGRRGGRSAYGIGSVSTNITSRWKEDGTGTERRAKHRGDADADGTGNGNGNSFALRDLKNSTRTHTEVQGHSPSASEEEIMTYNGIVRTMNVSVQYDQDQESSRDREHSPHSRPDSSLGVRRSLSAGGL